MDFSERLELYLEGGMLSKEDVDDVNAIIKMFKDNYGYELTEENAATFIAHICAALGRVMTNEEVEALPKEVSDELEGLPTYSKSLDILKHVMQVTHKPLNKTEQDYALLHINNLISFFNESGSIQN